MSAPRGPWSAEMDAETRHFVDPPADPDSTGNPGDVAADAGFIYVCYAANTWVRCAIDDTFGS